MKLPPFDYARQHWDRFRAFHTNNYPFIQFASGELILADSSPDPDLRQHYKPYNLTITMTTDPQCPSLYLEPWVEGAKPVPRTHLTRSGGQYLLIDHCLNTAVRIGYDRDVRKNVPVNLRNEAYVYFAGEGLPAQGLPIEVSPPRLLSAEEKARITTRVAECRLWASMQEDMEARNKSLRRMRELCSWSEARYPLHNTDLLAHANITEVPEGDRYRVAAYGVRTTYIQTKVERLYVRPGDAKT
jgi:hypothetical protein